MLFVPKFQLFAFRDVTGGGSISVATDGHSLKWLLPEPASPGQGKLKSGREENKAKSTGHLCPGSVGAHLHSRAEAVWWKRC